MSETVACTQVEIDQHRWYVVLRITAPDGTVSERVVACPMNDGMVVYDSLAEYEAANG